MRTLALKEDKIRLVIRFIALLFTILCINTLRDTGNPRPVHLTIINGILMSLLLNASLWTVSFNVNPKLKYMATLLLIPSGLGVSFVMTDYHIVGAILALLIHIWLIVSILSKNEMVS